MAALTTRKESIAYQKQRQKSRGQRFGSTIESKSYGSQSMDITKLLELKNVSVKNSEIENIEDSWGRTSLKSGTRETQSKMIGRSKTSVSNGNEMNQGMLHPNSTISSVNYDCNGINMNSRGNYATSIETSNNSHVVTMNAAASEFCIVFVLFCSCFGFI